jgi:hypothetical protein
MGHFERPPLRDAVGVWWVCFPTHKPKKKKKKNKTKQKLSHN